MDFEPSDIPKAFDFSIKSLKDGSEIFSRNKTSSRRLEEEEEPALAQQFDFSWSVLDFDESNIDIQFDIDNAGSLSDLESDQLKVRLLDTEVFKSKSNGDIIDLVGMKNIACGGLKGTMCMNVPPIVTNVGTRNAIQQSVQQAESIIQGLIAGNIFMVIFVGGSVQELWATIRSMQFAMLMVFIKISYPAPAYLFLLNMADIANLDIL